MRISFQTPEDFAVCGPGPKEVKAWDLHMRGKKRKANRLLDEVIREDPCRAGCITAWKGTLFLDQYYAKKATKLPATPPPLEATSSETTLVEQCELLKSRALPGPEGLRRRVFQ